MKKLYVCLLAILLSMSFLFSCGTERQEQKNDEPSVTSTMTEDRSELDDLDEYDFEGYEFKILNRTSDGWTQGRYDFTELTGDLYEDEVYMRNRRLEHRFNIKITMSTTTDRLAARPIILAGSNEYDMYTSRNAEVYTLAQEGLLNNIKDLEYIDLSKKYWNEFLSSQLTIAEKQYFAVGSFDTSSLDYCFVMVFNKDLIQNYGLETPFDLIKEGTWTFDNYAEMSKVGTMDLNGDAVIDGNDACGFICRPSDVLPNFWVGGGVTAAEKDGDDIPQNMMGTEKFFNVIDKIFYITHGINTFFNPPNNDMTGTLFANGNLLFYGTTFFNLKFLRNMETDFGILPYPKYDETQEFYYTRLGGGELFFTGKSSSQEDLDRTSIILEAMACESHKTCLPAYYELVLKTKLTRDEESEEIIDYIVSHRVFDWVDNLWVSEIRDGVLNTMFASKSNTIISLNASLENMFNQKRDSMVEAFMALED